MFVDDGKEMDLPEAERTLFSVYLNPKFRQGLKIDSDELENDEVKPNNELKLYKCSEEAGTYRIFEIKSGTLLQTDLNSSVSIYFVRGLLVWRVGLSSCVREPRAFSKIMIS